MQCISLTQEVAETANKQLWEKKLGDFNTFTYVMQGWVCVLTVVSIKGSQRLAKISFAFLSDFQF